MSPLHGLMRLAVASVLVLALVGCESPPAEEVANVLSGKVLYKGFPVPGGSITFYPEGSEVGALKALLQPDGSYRIGGIPKGRFRVTVETDSVKPAEGDVDPAAKAINPPPGTTMPEYYKTGWQNRYRPIPERYTTAAGTDLFVEIQGGQQTRDFVLRD